MSIARQQGDPRGRESESSDPEAVLNALEDKASREIIDRLDSPMTVAELAENSTIPRSSLYRKLKTLVEAGIVDPTIRPTTSGKHPTQYERSITEISISFDDGFEIECQHD